MKTKKYIVIVVMVLALGAIGAFFTYSYMYKPHRNVSEESAIAVMSATELQERFANANGTLESFADKIIEVNGYITTIEQSTTIMVDDKVQVDFDSHGLDEKTLVNGANVTVKGRCVGYDDLLEIVKVDQAVLINNQ
ncbi:MAG: hypothetical protein AAFZ89_12705 [Bacteroidota bacterium]